VIPPPFPFPPHTHMHTQPYRHTYQHMTHVLMSTHRAAAQQAIPYT